MPSGVASVSALRVAEVFGPTVQGEGPSTGRRAMFVRLSGCNLDCSWCDTPYTWDWTGKNGTAYEQAAEMRVMSSDDVVGQLWAPDSITPRLVVITGGEPLVQATALRALVAALTDHGFEVEVETNGTRAPSVELAAWVSRWNVSPKLTHSGVDRDRAFKADALIAFSALAHVERAIFKVVVSNVDDLDEVDAMCEQFTIPSSSVWVMPEGRQADKVARRLAGLADAAIERGYNLSGRMHVELWGDARGH